jgi:DNA-binding NarL/FixJ family response regulator/anti-sigma regulatory factor (Ser/Thr protein kinase)
MPIILLVEDSEVDRRYMAGLLERDFDWLISHANNGAEAIGMMADATPDVVVTDLVMPELDGMQLVSQMTVDFPDVPVVLVTGQHDATLAFKALRHGAASYVPKAQLADQLLETVEQVLALRDADRMDERIIQHTTNTRFRFELDNDPTLIAPLVDRIQQGMIGMQLCSATQRMHIGIALEEALLNAMYHGNLELPAEKLSDVRKLLHDGQPSELVNDRREQEPYRDRRIHVAADFTRKRAQFVVADDGKGFNVKEHVHQSTTETMEEEPGRGLVLMQTFMDEVLFNEAGNELRMTLRDLRPKHKA